MHLFKMRYYNIKSLSFILLSFFTYAMLRDILISICGRLPLSPFFPKGTINAARQWGTLHHFGTFPRTGTDLVVSSHMFRVTPSLHYQKAQNSPCFTFYSLVGVRTSVHVTQQTHSISLFLTGKRIIWPQG